MKRRIKKKKWKEETTAQQADLLERVAALEKLSQHMIAEQNTQRERVTAVSDDLMIYKAAQRKRQEQEAKKKLERECLRREREDERRANIKSAAMIAGAMSFLIFALMLPAPERSEPVSTAEPMVVAVDPADGVIEAMAMSWEG